MTVSFLDCRWSGAACRFAESEPIEHKGKLWAISIEVSKLSMESHPVLPDGEKYRSKLKSIATFVFIFTLFACFGGMGIGLLLTISGFVGHDEPSQPGQQFVWQFAFETLGIALLSPIPAGIALLFVNARTYRGIYLTLASLVLVFPFPIYLIYRSTFELGLGLLILPLVMICLLVNTLFNVKKAENVSSSDSV